MGFMQVLNCVGICHGKDFHPGGFRAAQAGDGILDDQTGAGGDGLIRASPIQGIEGVEKRLRIGFSPGDVFCAGDVEKFFSEPSLFKDELDFMAEGSGRNGQWVDRGGFAHKLAHTGENNQVILDGLQIGLRFPLHQLRDRRGVDGTMVCGQRRDKAASIVIAKVVGVVVGFGQADADFSQCLAKTSEMERLGVRDHPIKVKDDR